MFPATTTNATDTRCNGGKQREVERVGKQQRGKGRASREEVKRKGGPSCLVSVLKEEERVRGQSGVRSGEMRRKVMGG